MICGLSLKRMDRSTAYSSSPHIITYWCTCKSFCICVCFPWCLLYGHYFHLQCLSAFLPARSRSGPGSQSADITLSVRPSLPLSSQILSSSNLSQVVLLSPGRSPKQMYERARKMFGGVIEFIRICLGLADTKPMKSAWEHFVSQESSFYADALKET